MALSVKNLIDLLKEQGYIVKAYKRKDGGYLIQEINGLQYKGSKGNEAARKILNVSISQRRAKQLKSITPKKGSKAAKERKVSKAKKPPKTPLPPDLKKELEKAQRLLRKQPTKTGGTITTSNIRWILENKGKEKAEEAIQKATAYAQGIAYPENVAILISRIQSVMNQMTKASAIEYMQKTIEWIDKHVFVFREDWIAPVYDLLYNISNYADELTAAKNFYQSVSSLA